MLCGLHYFSFKCATDVKQMMKLFEAFFVFLYLQNMVMFN